MRGQVAKPVVVNSKGHLEKEAAIAGGFDRTSKPHGGVT